MSPPPLLFRAARVLTLGHDAGPRRGAQARDLGVIERADVAVAEGRVVRIGEGLEPAPGGLVIDAAGRVLMPAFIDAHTHACWAGSRLDEWEARLAGATYLEILARGGGIMSTVRAVRDAPVAVLRDGLLGRLRLASHEGTAAIEVKSGYGLSTPAELKMLDAILGAASRWPGVVRATACIGHAIEGDHAAFVDRTILETLPAVAAAHPGVTLDAYCEKGAWSLDDCVRLFTAGADLGLPFRVHADQFNALGMTDAAVSLGARSVDHLEATPPDAIERLAASKTFGVMLPCSGFHVDGRYAPGRRFLDAGGALVVATNANPGSAPCLAVPMAISLGVRYLGLTAAEAITASTVNAAALLGIENAGRVAPGCRADLVLLRHTDERELAHSFGGRAVDATVIAGSLVYAGGVSTASTPG